MRLKSSFVTAALLLAVVAAWGANPEANPLESLSTFRVTTAEVHLNFVAVRDKNRIVKNLLASDFSLLRDGRAINQVLFEKYTDAPISALVLTDVSDSMAKAVPQERASAEWLRSKATPKTDHISFVDFGAEIGTTENQRVTGHLTSLYDALFDSLNQFHSVPGERRAIILLTDGVDNNSLHGLRDVITLAQRFDIAVYAITAHPGKNQYYRPDVLRYLCEQTGGKFYEARKLDAVLAATAAINDELRNGYEVVFSPDVTGAGMHEVLLRPNQPGLRFYYRSAYYQPEGTTDVAFGE